LTKGPLGATVKPGGDALHGSASFPGVARGVLESRIDGAGLGCVMQTEGSSSAHVPVEFAAGRGGIGRAGQQPLTPPFSLDCLPANFPRHSLSRTLTARVAAFDERLRWTRDHSITSSACTMTL
jgi:hypothetical protein